MGKHITFGKLKNPDLINMGNNITFGIYKNIPVLNNMGENGPTAAGRPPNNGGRFSESRMPPNGTKIKNDCLN